MKQFSILSDRHEEDGGQKTEQLRRADDIAPLEIGPSRFVMGVDLMVVAEEFVESVALGNDSAGKYFIMDFF